MKAVFTIPKRDRLIVTEEFFCNGHWAIKRSHANKLKAFSKVANLQHGNYSCGYGEAPYGRAPDVNAIWEGPSRGGETLTLSNEVAWKNENEISRVTYTFPNGDKIAVAPRYMPILQLGTPKAKDKLSPISVRDENGEQIALVIPMRLQ